MAKKKERRATIPMESKTTADKWYYVVIWSDNSISCNCPSWIFSGKNRRCKHISQLIGDAYVADDALAALAPMVAERF